MKNKMTVTDEMLMAFLYGELSGEEKRRVEDYLKENPAKQAEMESFGNLRSVFGKLKDVEDIDIPELEFDIQDNHYTPWKWMAIAASVALFCTLGWISFNSLAQDTKAQPDLVITQNQLQKLLDHQVALQEQNEKLMDKINNLENNIGKVSEDQKSQQMALASLKNYSKTDDNIEKYMVALQEQNRELMEGYIQTAALQQQQYLQTVLTDFNEYIAQQRKQDVLFLQAQIEHLAQNTGEFQNATAQLVASMTNNRMTLNNK